MRMVNPMETNVWSTYVQNPSLMEGSRLMILNHDQAHFVAEKLSLYPGARVLEVGCGTGAFCYYLGETSQSVEYTGIDNDARLIAYAQQKPSTDSHGNTYCFLEADAAELPFAPESFDIVVSHTFLTAAVCYEVALQEMQRVCRSGGIVATMNISDFDQTLHRTSSAYDELACLEQKFIQACETVRPLRSVNAGIDPQRIPEFFSASGLKNVAVYPVGSFFSLNNSDAAFSPEKKRSVIIYMRDALLEKIAVFSSFPGFETHMPHEECERLKVLACERAEHQLQNLSSPDRWEMDAWLYLLVVGENVHRQKTEESAEDALWEYRHSKYKEARPEETVRNIQTILARLGISTVVNWTQPGTEALYSCRVLLEGTQQGQNGKGTAPNYALASGYGEFMERLSAGFLIPFPSPDQLLLTPEQTAEQGDELLTKFFAEIYGVPAFAVSKESLLKKWEMGAEKDGRFVCLPFTRLKDGARFVLPEFLFRSFVYTNGSCAGNSREEALLQGICEIMERYASVRILRQKLSPPVIPSEVIDAVPELRQSITSIEQESGMRVIMLDASLGKNLPVVCAVLLDLAGKTSCVHFGAHPRFEVAMERALTELLQGRKLKERVGMSPFGEEWEETASSPNQVFNVLKLGYGVVSTRLLAGLAGNASWQFQPFESCSRNNSAMLHAMLALCEKMGWDVYLRDCTFFDFPVYHLLIPQASMILNFGKISLAQTQQKLLARPALMNFAAASEAEKAAACKVAALFSGWQLHETLDHMTGIPFAAELFGVSIRGDLLEMLDALYHKNYSRASELLLPYARANEAFWCLLQLCQAAQRGEEDTLLPYLVKNLESLRQAKAVWADPYSVLPACSYPSCGECGRSCQCPAAHLLPIAHRLAENAQLPVRRSSVS